VERWVPEKGGCPDVYQQAEKRPTRGVDADRVTVRKHGAFKLSVDELTGKPPGDRHPSPASQSGQRLVGLPAGDHKESHEAQVHKTVSYIWTTSGLLKLAMIEPG
jgi:hypothetical protein